MTRLGPQPLRLWVAGRPRRPLGPRARWQRPPVREAWPAEWKRSGPERACPGAGRHGPALLSLGQERGPRGHGRRLWVSGRLLRYWCAHTVLVRGRAPALAWRVTDGPRSRLVTWGGGSGPYDAGDAHLQRRSSQPVALYPLAVRTQWHSGSVLRLRAHGAHTPGVSRLCHCRVAGRHPSSSAASGRDAWLHWRASHLAEVTLSLSRTLMRNRRKRLSQLTRGGGEAATPQQVLVPSPPCGLRRL